MLFLLLAVMALEAAGAESGAAPPMREIDAWDILEKIQKGQPVEYDHVVVRDDLDLSWERLHRNITSPIRINDSIFNGQVSFNDITFEKAVDLSGTNFTRNAYFLRATFGGYYADFREAKFSEDAYFSYATFSKDAYFNDATFSKETHFELAVFRGSAGFKNAMFSKIVSFSYSTFGGSVDFDESIFSGDAEFFDATFSSFVYFENDTFSGKADFSEAMFSERAKFGMATFNGDADFSGAEFSGDAEFWNATFNKNAIFDGTKFSLSDFTRAIFRCDARFWETTFSKDAYFSEAEFSGIADFGGIILLPFEPIFKEATSSMKTYMIGAAFRGNAYFDSTNFTGETRFDEAEFNGIVEFSGSRFENETSFYRILLKRPAYFENCSIESLNLTKAEYSWLHLRWDYIESLHFDEAAYLALIKNYNNLGWYDDANDCYFDYRNAVRKNCQAVSSQGFAARISNLLDRLIDFGEWLLYGYGVRPSFPMAWSVVIILAFGLSFRQKRCLRKIITEERIEEARDLSDEVLIKTTTKKAPLNFLDPFLFSLFTFTSGFTAFLHPAVEYKLERCLRWAIFERLLGPFFLALVITTISKTYLIR